MPKKSGKTFRLAFVRRKIHTMFESRALKAALLAELNGGQDAALVVQMVERVTPVAKPPIQAVAPLPQQSEEEEEEAPAAPVNPPTPVEAPPPVRPVIQPTQVEAPQATTSDGHTAATAVEISDTDSDSD